MARKKKTCALLRAISARLITPDRARIAAIAKDLRTIGVHGMTVGLAGGLLTSDKITVLNALLILAVGFGIWAAGTLLTSEATKSDD